MECLGLRKPGRRPLRAGQYPGRHRLQALGRANQLAYYRYEGRNHQIVPTHPDLPGRVEAFLAPLR